MAYTISVLATLPVIMAVLLYQLDTFAPAQYPDHELTPKQPLFVPKRNTHMLHGSEKIGAGELLGPEDVAYDPITGIIYTGTTDGWINRVTVNESAAESKVERWVNTGGRPLGLVHGHHGEVIIADAVKGLLNVTRDGTMELLTDEADGLKFKVTDAVDITLDGILYFTDASSKYALHEFLFDFLEGRPHGRFMSYDPSTKQTKVLLRDLYFPNGVVISPDQHFVIFCETPMRMCKRYYIKGEKRGSVDTFIENLPGLPDNIRYDGEGRYWIALPTGNIYFWTLTQRYAFIRKAMAIVAKYMGEPPRFQKNGGIFAVDFDGKPIAHYYDHDLYQITSGTKIGEHLYCGSIQFPYITRLNISQYPAT
ncbi:STRICTOSIDINE SYNTHASE-LIKE 6-like [Olea europaea subsp. europaea]|uniref:STRICTOSIDINE SYNTHASE-LIKE 6-like n=1 Tax=Olea europaea subsp. europaea TaxID=158383 RepID=A0A8S0R091_OLEEU|nr:STRICTOSIDINE SYNTHASE-LIKE 6-like [Olea europaea subsp. europaea]